MICDEVVPNCIVRPCCNEMCMPVYKAINHRYKMIKEEFWNGEKIVNQMIDERCCPICGGLDLLYNKTPQNSTFPHITCNRCTVIFSFYVHPTHISIQGMYCQRDEDRPHGMWHRMSFDRFVDRLLTSSNKNGKGGSNERINKSCVSRL